MYVYQGEELGLPEVEDIPSDRRQDPMWLRSGGVDPGRDGCRVPIPGPGDEPPYGFSRDGADRPWLDQPDDWAPLTVERRASDAGLDARPVPRRPAPAPRRRRGTRDATLRWLPVRRRRARVRARRRGSPASSTSARTRWNFRPAPTSSSPATSSKEVRSRRTPRSGSARPRNQLRIGLAAPTKHSIR